MLNEVAKLPEPDGRNPGGEKEGAQNAKEQATQSCGQIALAAG